MLAGAEGHAGVEADDRLALSRAVRAPCRADHQARAHPQDGEELLPGVGPVFFAQPAATHRRRQGEGSQPSAQGSPPPGEVTIGGEVALDYHRRLGPLDAHAAIDVATEHVGHGLLSIGGCLNAQLEPAGGRLLSRGHGETPKSDGFCSEAPSDPREEVLAQGILDLAQEAFVVVGVWWRLQGIVQIL